MDVGEILKPQGIRGEVKVRPLTDDSARFRMLKTVTVCGKPYKVEAVRIADNGVFIKLAGVDDRNAAEALRGKFVSIDRAAAVPLGENEFFIADLIGAKLCSSRGDTVLTVGTIERIDNFGAADVFTVVTVDGKRMTFAFVKALMPRFDENTRTLTVDGDRLDEVAIYED